MARVSTQFGQVQVLLGPSLPMYQIYTYNGTFIRLLVQLRIFSFSVERIPWFWFQETWYLFIGHVHLGFIWIFSKNSVADMTLIFQIPSYLQVATLVTAMVIQWLCFSNILVLETVGAAIYIYACFILLYDMAIYFFLYPTLVSCNQTFVKAYDSRHGHKCRAMTWTWGVRHAKLSKILILDSAIFVCFIWLHIWLL